MLYYEVPKQFSAEHIIVFIYNHVLPVITISLKELIIRKISLPIKLAMSQGYV